MMDRKKLIELLLMVMLVICDYSAYQVFKIYSDYNSSSSEYKKLEEEYVVAQSDESNPGNEVFKVDHFGLKMLNSDYQGWLKSDGLDISLPVMRAQDNEYYLHRTFEGEYRFAGSLFIDYRFGSFYDPYVIVYGHHMKDGTMFANISNYKTREYYEEYPTFSIYIENRKMTYEIFSFFETDTDSPVYEYYIKDEDVAAQFKYLKENSYYETGTTYYNGDRIIVLSTCVYSEGEERWVLCARLNNIETIN